MPIQSTLRNMLHFNSIKVRLELAATDTVATVVPYFNSIKVRLEPSQTQPEGGEFLLFQFHKGTIRTESAHSVSHD